MPHCFQRRIKNQILINTMQLFDSHCHFDFAEFNPDRSAIWQACNERGVTGILMPGVSPDQWQIAAQLCAQFPGLFYAAGIHPHWIERQHGFQKNSDGLLSEKTLQRIGALIGEEIASSVKNGVAHCLAVGECGLDKSIAVPLELQQQLLNLHIDLANQLHKPLIIHSLKTHNELLSCFKHHPPRYGGVIHAFSGSVETAQQFVARGFLLGVGGTITYERAHKTRHALSQIPLQYLLLETDAPDMPLCGQQGERNSPEYLPLIAQQLADLRGLSIEQVAEATSHNARRLLGAP
jgi:TatD DNase family protein